MLSDALAAGDVWVPTSRLHRSLDVLLEPKIVNAPAILPGLSMPNATTWLDQRARRLDESLLDVARGLSGADPALFAGDKLRFPKESKDTREKDEIGPLTRRVYGIVPTTRITDVLSQVERWTGFIS